MKKQPEFDASTRILLQHVQVGVAVCDADLRIVSVNRKAIDILGLGEEELIGKVATSPRWKLVGTDGRDLAPHENPFLRLSSKTRAIQDLVIGMFVPNKNEILWAQLSADPVFDTAGTIDKVIITFIDITERRKAEEALRESEEQYRSLVENTRDIAYRITPGGEITYMSPQARAFGFEPAEMASKHFAEFVHPDDRRRVMEAFAGTLLSGGGSPVAFRALTKDNCDLWLEESGHIQRDSAGNVTGFAGVMRDVTERRRAEDGLRESEEKFRSLFMAEADAIVLFDGENGFFREVNGAAVKLYGYSREEFLSLHYTAISAEPDATIASVNRTLAASADKVALRYHRKKDGTVFPVEISTSTVRLKGRILVCTIVRDITERKRTEEELQRAEKLESLSVFAGGIAHDFNNLLGGVFGYMEMARETLRPNTRAADYLDNALSSFERAKHLSRQMVTFAKGGAPVKKPLNLGELLRETSGLALCGSNVKAEFATGDDLWMLEADENQLSQVFSNLLINARQAMPKGGVVTVAAQNRSLEANAVGHLPAGTYVAVVIKDRGSGIPQELFAKIFDPFFTTKAKGSGLGLSTSYSIVNRHGGHIEVASEPGAGAAFTVWLPASVGSAAPFSAPARDRSPRRSCHGRILVMDDEQAIREMVRDMLVSAGYKVTLAADGEAAVAKYRKAFTAGTPFDLVIFDLTVPGAMGGETAMAALRKIDPGALGIVSSGYADNPVLANAAQYGFAGVTAKPYRKRELLETVKSVLGKKRAIICSE